MDVVVVGAGEVGYHLAEVLSREGHRVRVIESDAAQAGRVRETLDVQVFAGDATHADVLTRAGAPRADLFVAVTDDDHVNMLVCTLARHMGAKRVILRVRDPAQLAGYHYFYKQTLGFDLVLSVDELAAEEILGTVRQQRALEVESFADGRVQLRRLRLREAGTLTSAPLADLELPPGALLAAVVRREQLIAPGGEDRLEVDDQLYLIGRAGDLDRFEELAGAPRERRCSVVIMGGSGVGARIARRLDDVPGVSVRLVERSAARARELAARFSRSVTVLVGDATDLDLLVEERIGEANAFVATTGDDERNIVACQLARSLGVERTVALVNRASYRQVYDVLGVDRAISPRILCANRILRFVRSRSLASVAVVAEGRGEVLELEAHFREGRKVKNLGLPRGTVVGAIVRGDEVVVPDGDATVRGGDHVILFTLPDDAPAVEQVFRPGGALE